MKIEVPKPVTIEVAAVRVDVPVRYEEDREEFAGVPGFDGRRLRLTIGLDDGVVEGWDGVARELHTKVCDEGTYTLLGPDGGVLASRDWYVPSLLPGQHYGDYIELQIGADGVVSDWRPTTEDLAWWFGESD